MDFIEWLEDQRQECIELIKSNAHTRQLNPADLVEAVNRFEKISAALSLYKAFNQRG